MYQTKIFMGTGSDQADDKFNAWIQDHPDIEIIEFRYQQARYSDHSIAILYKT